jgi:hypothetical protein
MLLISSSTTLLKVWCSGVLKLCALGWPSDYIVSLWAGGFGDQITVGARFYAPVQIDAEAHPASITMGIVSFPGVKPPRGGVDHPSVPRIEVQERVQL